jgi:hypothetical protein
MDTNVPTYNDSAVDYAAYQAKALATEKRTMEIVTDKEALVGALKVAIAAGEFMSLVKKAVIYGKEITIDDMVERTKGIERAIDGFETALFREVPEDYDGEVVPCNGRVLHGAIGAFGEAGELLEWIVAHIEGAELNVPEIVGELGDGQWYPAIIMDALGIKLAEVLHKNNLKLTARHGGKPLTLESSESRNVELESAILADSVDKTPTTTGAHAGVEWDKLPKEEQERRMEKALNTRRPQKDYSGEMSAPVEPPRPGPARHTPDIKFIDDDA